MRENLRIAQIGVKRPYCETSDKINQELKFRLFEFLATNKSDWGNDDTLLRTREIKIVDRIFDYE